eukprot:1145053-Pelagomonas_calceolata.AAC.4
MKHVALARNKQAPIIRRKSRGSQQGSARLVRTRSERRPTPPGKLMQLCSTLTLFMQGNGQSA